MVGMILPGEGGSPVK